MNYRLNYRYMLVDLAIASVKKIITYLLLIYSVIMVSHAHVWQSVYVETKLGKYDLISELRFDASVIDPETKDDPTAPQRKREWLERLTADEHLQLQSAAEIFLRDCFVFEVTNQETVSLESIYTFPDWDRLPPRFVKTLDDGAYFNVRIITPLPESGTIRLLNKKSESSPNLSLKFTKRDTDTYSRSLLSPGIAVDLLTISPPENTTKPAIVEVVQPSFSQQVSQGITVGFLHVLSNELLDIFSFKKIPEGLDHVLFIAALCFVCVSWKKILLHSLVFTLCHSVTFILLSTQIITLSNTQKSIVEIIILASIAAMAVENLLNKQSPKRRLVLISVFGLVHGLGFASSFGENIAERGTDYMTLLISANLGIELAQLTILAILFLALFRLKESARTSVNRYSSIAVIIAALALAIF